MPEYKDKQPITDKVKIVLTGPDGKVKKSRTVGGKENVSRKVYGWFLRQFVHKG